MKSRTVYKFLPSRTIESDSWLGPSPPPLSGCVRLFCLLVVVRWYAKLLALTTARMFTTPCRGICHAMQSECNSPWYLATKTYGTWDWPILDIKDPVTVKLRSEQNASHGLMSDKSTLCPRYTTFYVWKGWKGNEAEWTKMADTKTTASLAVG